jgi:hypothetical protein
MSYLDTPRLHFVGTFNADPSTINNTPQNYGYNPASANPISLAPSWNPYGSNIFTINATVTSFVDKDGNLHLSGDPDPLIGASFGSATEGTPPKLVDLDTEQQSVTRLYGLNLQLTLRGGNAPSLQGLWDNSGTLANLWFSKVPALAGSDNGAGGAFQSVLQRIQWDQLTGSPLLQQLQNVAENGLSVRLSVWGYDAATTDSTFRTGIIAGTVGPQFDGEPLHLAPRLLIPTSGSQLNCAVAKVNSAGTVVTLDLGNSIPANATPQGTAGSPIDLGTMNLVLLGDTPGALGAIDYQGQQFLDTAGVVPLPITPQQAGNPFGIIIDDTLALQESNPYIDVDGYSVYMNPRGTVAPEMPGGTASVNVWAFNLGMPAPGVEVPLSLVPLPSGFVPPGSAAVNTPATALTFPRSVTTLDNGVAALSLTAGDPGANARPNIAGQLYFIGGPWASPLTTNAAAPLTVKVFSSELAGGDELTWAAVQPILYRFYYMYGFMASIVDLSSYADVQENSKAILQVLTTDFNDGGYMPVTREMAAAERNLIVAWIDAGCPA